ncbi:serine/arginine repetitive matrix protein 2-like [Megalops cyprinoides]|uniref:serine/arginine repetitive matrix protein 2-like n=1 Tax=Megalops cyprinoides TaxID=118141 RepID=UPI001863C16F|nr:serine/arginine repetitive matrix protein 2-like [Megalops cyprinoides]
MTIKLLRDSVNEDMKNLKVEIESFSIEDFPQEPVDPLEEECSSGKPDDINSVPLKSESASLLAEVEAEPKGEGGHRERSGSMERRWSSRSWRQRSPAGEHTRGRSRSRSREWGHRYECKCSWSRSRSRSRERSGRGSRRWSRSRSRERTSVRYGRRSDSRERAANQARRRSRSPSPAWDGGSRRKRSTNDAHAGHSIVRDRSREAPHTVQLDQSAQEVPRRNDILDDELVRKKRELELLEEQIARKRAIIAMEQKGLTPKVHPREEQDYDSHLPTDNAYYQCRLPLESEHDTPLKDVRSTPGPILKKRAEPFELDNYLQTEFTKKPSLDQNFLSQSHLDQPPGDHSLHQISVRYSHFSEPSGHPSLGHPVSQHVPVHHPPLEKSAPHQIPPHPPTHSQSSVDQPPVCHSPPDREPAPKSNISTQFDRFLRILNKGVDVNLLTTLVRETKEETAAYEKQTAHQLPQNEVPYKDRDPYKDSYGRRPEEQEDLGESSQDFLLPHERACQDGIGFSRIVRMKHGVQEEEPYWKEGDVEDEERFLYGERAFGDEDEQETSVPPDRKHRGPSPSWPAAEKPLSVANGEDKMQHYDKIQSLLQTIGLDLDTAEVSKLTDRTQERLYGKKLKAKPPESEQTRSVSPVQSSRREVYMSYSSTLEHGSTHNQRSHREVPLASPMGLPHGLPPAYASKTCTEVKNVWICGHSLVFWAEKRAKSPEYGKQLGMDSSCVRVWWKGMQGMTWEQLLPLLLKLKGSWPNPDVIILHLGGNDLGKTDPKGLLAAMKKDLTSLKSIFPQCLLVWSDILLRRSWRTTEGAEAMESTRVSVNKKVHTNIAELATHHQIRPGSDTGLYWPDGVHLLGKGIDTFNNDMQDFLEKWETKLNETANQS